MKEHPALEESVDGGAFDEEAPAQVTAMAAVRVAIAGVLGCAHPPGCGASRHWQPHLVQAWVTAAGDVEVDVPRWLRHGTPMGIEVPIIPRGVFPEVTPEEATADLESISARMEPTSNYKSFDDARDVVEPELKRLRTAGYLKALGTWDEVKAFFGDDVAVSKLAAILKTRPDGSLKTRLVVDYCRSGVNSFVKANE